MLGKYPSRKVDSSSVMSCHSNRDGSIIGEDEGFKILDLKLKKVLSGIFFIQRVF